MSYTEVDICNRALSRLGCNTVSSPTGLVKDIVENSLEAKVCRSYYEQIRDSVLEARVWSFALNQDTIEAAPDADLPNGGAIVPATVRGVRVIQGWTVYALPDGTDTTTTEGFQTSGAEGLELRGETAATEEGYFRYQLAAHAVVPIDAIGTRDYRVSFTTDTETNVGKLAVAVVRGVFDAASPPTDFYASGADLYAVRGYDSGFPLDADAEAVIARMEPTPEAGRQLLVETLVGQLKSAGVWDKLDSLQVYRAHSEQAALLDWVNATRSAVNEGALFSVDDDIATSSGNYVRTQFIPAAGSLFTLNSASFGVFITSARSAGGTALAGGQGGASSTTQLSQPGSGGGTTARGYVSSGGGYAEYAAGEPLAGFLHTQRTSATDLEVYYQDNAAATATVNTNTLSPAELFVGAANLNGSAGASVSAGFGAFWAGAALSGGEVAALREALTYYLMKVVDPNWEAG